MTTARRLILIAALVAGCGKSKGDECPAACEHLVELNVASLDGMGADPEMIADVKRELQRPIDPGRATCVAKCREGKLDARCTLAAKTIEAAMQCGRKR